MIVQKQCGHQSEKNGNILTELNPDRIEILAENLEVPWGMGFLPDGQLIFTERSGDISLLNVDTKELKKIHTRDIKDRAEGGLLGLAVDPDFASSHFIFIYETIETGNRIVRLKMEQEILAEDKILIDKIPHAMFHDGGILRFGPDGFLYAGTGDARDPNSAQDLNSYAGKILRMDKNGIAPNSNPFQNLIYSYGHRNVQGICWDKNGNMFASEHGPSGELNGWCCHDELNIINAGANYGWPFVIGENKKEQTIAPLLHSGDDTWAPGGVVWIEDSQAKIQGGNIFIACLRGEEILKVSVTDFQKEDFVGATTSAVLAFIGDQYGRIRNLILAPDGSLIFCSSNKDGRGNPNKTDDKIYRIHL